MSFGEFGSHAIKKLSGESQIPDSMLFGYSLERLFSMLHNFGLEGRNMYLKFQYIDYFYPLVYSTLLVALLIRVKLSYSIRYVIYLPWVAAIFDYGENVLIRNEVLNFPHLNANLVAIASTLTITKWFLVFISVILVVVYWFASLWQKRKIQKKSLQ